MSTNKPHARWDCPCTDCLRWLAVENGRLRDENAELLATLEQLTTTTTRYISGEEVERYCAMPLMERLKDRGGLMKCVPGAVVDTIIEATKELERLRDDNEGGEGE